MALVEEPHWYRLSDHNEWQPYDDDCSSQIECAYRTNAESVKLTQGPFFKMPKNQIVVIVFHRDYYPPVFLEINNKTNTSTKIKRVCKQQQHPNVSNLEVLSPSQIQEATHTLLELGCSAIAIKQGFIIFNAKHNQRQTQEATDLHNMQFILQELLDIFEAHQLQKDVARTHEPSPPKPASLHNAMPLPPGQHSEDREEKQNVELEADGNTWICKQCTLENEATSQICVVCNWSNNASFPQIDAENDDDGEVDPDMPAYARSVPQAPPHEHNKPAASSWSSNNNSNVSAKLSVQSPAVPVTAMTYVPQHQHPIYVVQQPQPVQVVHVTVPHGHEGTKERLLAPVSSTFECRRCGQTAKHSDRTRRVANRGRTDLYCQQCHTQWICRRNCGGTACAAVCCIFLMLFMLGRAYS
mmetsp:Transcript_15896/g.25209  ORF Transcript_15896/g.25209 Transcript_15896/m.25209 type:complete len:412 (-) Transcript_15896:205-1440(-)